MTDKTLENEMYKALEYEVSLARDTANRYIVATARAKKQNKAKQDTPEWRNLATYKRDLLSPELLIELCDAWRELQLIKSQSTDS